MPKERLSFFFFWRNLLFYICLLYNLTEVNKHDHVIHSEVQFFLYSFHHLLGFPFLLPFIEFFKPCPEVHHNSLHFLHVHRIQWMNGYNYVNINTMICFCYVLEKRSHNFSAFCFSHLAYQKSKKERSSILNVCMILKSSCILILFLTISLDRHLFLHFLPPWIWLQ